MWINSYLIVNGVFGCLESRQRIAVGSGETFDEWPILFAIAANGGVVELRSVADILLGMAHEPEIQSGEQFLLEGGISKIEIAARTDSQPRSQDVRFARDVVEGVLAPRCP